MPHNRQTERLIFMSLIGITSKVGEREVNVMAGDLLIMLEVEQSIVETIIEIMVLKSLIRKEM